MRRRGQEDHVHAAVNQLVEGTEPDKASSWGNLNLPGYGWDGFDSLQAPFEPIRENVCHGD
jgi:hypothetical protein